ncbi:hypothetical protein [Brevundimonas sp. TWP2-3-4b1]|uniref:hypothetical protein n=1 Tax=Brevundimonas sp. TWP2-3-4b1 TaxID=2804580 RepID=UPI003CF94EF2
MNSFWAQPSAWRRDIPSHIFLARAVSQAGLALFGSEWADADLAVQGAQRLSANPPLPIPASLSRRTPAQMPPSAEEWEARRRTADLINTNAAPRLGRASAAKRAVLDGLASGRLVHDLMDPKTGTMIVGRPEHWYVQNTGNRFHCCQMNPREPNSYAVAGGGFYPIYITRESLEGWLLSLGSGGSKQDWSASPEITLKEWCTLAVFEEARRRRLRAVSSNPSEAEIYRTIAHMWEIAGRDCGPTTWKTVQQYYIAAKSNRTGR